MSYIYFCNTYKCEIVIMLLKGLNYLYDNRLTNKRLYEDWWLSNIYVRYASLIDNSSGKLNGTVALVHFAVFLNKNIAQP